MGVVHDHQHRGQRERDGVGGTARLLRDGARWSVLRLDAARVHPRFHAPVSAIIAQAVWSGVLVLSGSLSQLVNYTGFAVMLFSGVAVAAVFVLRHREPDAGRPFRAWGYPFAPAVFVLASAVIVVNEIVRNPRPSLAGLAIIALGVPVYWWMRRSRSVAPESV